MDSKISNLNLATDLVDENVLPIVNSSETKKTTLLLIYNYVKEKFDLVYTTTSEVATQITSALSGYATQSYVNSQGFITNVITALGFTPENVANKQTDLTASATKYPTINAVNAGLATKQDVLGFTPTKIVIKDANASTAITGTTAETLVNTYLIPANTFNANDVIRISSFVAEKTGTVGTVSMRVKVGTTATFGSATTIATYVTSAVEVWCIMSRMALILRGGLLRGILFGSSRQTDLAILSIAVSTTSFNPAVDNYLFTSLQLSLGTESAFQSNLLITN